MTTDREIDVEMERRYGYFNGEHPNRGKIRLILETEPMALWLARREIRGDLDRLAAAIREKKG